MASISFSQVGSFNGVSGGPQVLENPTSLQFGPDGRLYVSEQNGAINAFTIEVQNGEYIATDHELLQLPSGAGVVQSIQNHNDDGTLNSIQARQVTGFVVAGTAANPVLYISSSDPRISNNGDINLDTNSGVVTRVTWNGSEWEAVDIIRGLPRSEENHSVNGLTLSPDGNTLYLAVGGNTNNGAPDAFFSFTSEFALSGTVLEIDLADLESRPILTDPNGGVNGAARQFIYDLPTLDDPTVANDGLREDANGVDVAGPFGGNDGFNQAILPADAPLRIFADGFRNNFDLVLTESGNLFTVDNGSNGGLGGDPIFVNGEATDQVSPGGTGDPEPLFLVTEGGFFGHPNPTRSNQDLEFVVRDDNGNPDASLLINTVPDLSALVPDGVDIADGFIIDPSRFTGDPDRLLESGIRVPFGSAESPALTTLGSSSNGLVEFTSDVFDGALQGALIVTQFNGNVTLLNVNEAGTGLEPLIGPGVDGLLGTADDEVIDNDGIFPLPGLSGQGLPLDVTVGPDGTIFVAEFGPDNINVFAPADGVQGFDTDFDDDGILNVNDPFTRDATNGGSATVLPGETVLFDFDANQDGNLVGPSGFGGGLTGAQINNATDFEAFFQEPSPFPGQIVNLDNVRFITAAGGGTTVVENVSNGTPFGTSNDGEFLFQTGVTIAPTVDTFTVTWNIFNPASEFATSSQRIGGFIGTGDQSNFLSITAGPDPNGEIQIVLEENDVAVASTFLQANDLFNVPANQQISFELEIDPTAGTATPTVTYETGNGTSTVSGGSISLAGTEVLEAILGNNTIQGQTTGLAVGLLSTNNADGNQPGADTFQAIFGDIEIAATGSAPPEGILFRVNAGGPQIAAVDGGPDWLADGAFLVNPGGSGTISFPAVEAGPTVDSSVPGAIFDTERFDFPGFTNLEYTFDVPEAGDYEVRLYFGEGFSGISGAGQRVFDVALEGSIPSSLDDVDLFSQFGPEVGGVISNVVTVNDGTLDIEFLAGIENPQINGIEIIQLEGGGSPPPTNPVVSIAATQDGAEPGSDGQFTVSLSEVASTDTVIAYTVGGTASAGEDFAALTETVTIAAGELTANIEVAVIDDQLDEPEESVTVTLDAVTAGDADVVIGASNAATVTITDDDEATPPDPSVLFRVNAGGPQIAAVDGGPDWLADGAFLVNPGGSGTVSFPAVEAGPTVDSSVPGAIFDTERFDFPGFTNLEYTFDVPEAGDYEVRLYFGNGFGGTSAPGQRVFDVALEGSIPSSLDDVDLSAQFGNQVGGVISNVVTVNDGTLDIEFLAGVENPLINGIEIIQLGDGSSSSPAPPTPPTPPQGDGSFLFSLQADETLNGITYSEQDVVLFNGTDFSLFFDGSDVSLPNTTGASEINALDVISPNELLLSFNQSTTLPGLGTVDDSDVVLFAATSFGENTAGNFSLYFDGGDVGLSSNAEDIDGLTRLSDGSLLISTRGDLNASGFSAVDEDVVLFNPTSLGGNTSGSFSTFVDGSDIDLTAGAEDIDAFDIDAVGDFFFSTRGDLSVSGVSGADDDVFAFALSSTGASTSGSLASDLFFDASQAGLTNDIRGLDLTFS